MSNTNDSRKNIAEYELWTKSAIDNANTLDIYMFVLSAINMFATVILIKLNGFIANINKITIFSSFISILLFFTTLYWNSIYCRYILMLNLSNNEEVDKKISKNMNKLNIVGRSLLILYSVSFLVSMISFLISVM